MKAKELIESLIEYNPDAEVVISIKGVEQPVTGILVASVDNEEMNSRLKMDARKVTLKTGAQDVKPAKRDNATRQAIEAVAYVLGYEPESVNPEMRLDTDLHADVLDMIDIAQYLERTLGVRMPTLEFNQRVEDIADIIRIASGKSAVSSK